MIKVRAPSTGHTAAQTVQDVDRSPGQRLRRRPVRTHDPAPEPTSVPPRAMLGFGREYPGQWRGNHQARRVASGLPPVGGCKPSRQTALYLPDRLRQRARMTDDGGRRIGIVVSCRFAPSGASGRYNIEPGAIRGDGTAHSRPVDSVRRGGPYLRGDGNRPG